MFHSILLIYMISFESFHMGKRVSNMSFYSIASKFNTFYNNHVVLSQEEQTNLQEKKDLNIDRLKAGLTAYNEDNGTSYVLRDYKTQGSIPMHTVVQNDQNEYDIDVAIIFNKSELPASTDDVKTMVWKALKKKTKQFKYAPKKLTNAIRVEYSDGYHVDFAIYRRSLDSGLNWTNEHCGNSWTSRDPDVIKNWFIDENAKSNADSIRKIVRLLKMFCKSRSKWSMPGGLLLSVLVVEQYVSKDSIDESFYETLCNIRDRLAEDKDVLNPKDDSISLIVSDSDRQKMKNLYTRLNNYIGKLSDIVSDDCTEEKAVKVWSSFFNHDYWKTLEGSYQNRTVLASAFARTTKATTEGPGKHIKTEVRVMWDTTLIDELEEGQRIDAEWFYEPDTSFDLSPNHRPLPKGKWLLFAYTGEPLESQFKIRWVVENEGDECGDDKTHSQEGTRVLEHTGFRGEHKMLCQIINRYNQVIATKTINIRVK